MRAARAVVVVVAVVAASGLAACGDHLDEREQLVGALRRTGAQPRSYSYREEAGGRRVSVDAVVEDDFRYGGRLALDGQPVFDQIVADDALILRVNAPELLPPVALTDSPPAEQALRSAGWVLDLDGAPPLTTAQKRSGPVGGRDVVTDSYRYLSSVERAVGEAERIFRFSEESIYYKPSEDPFPKPDEDSGITRYDLIRPRMPRAADQSGGGAGVRTRLPQTAHFRKLSVYVEKGLVVRVLERVAFDERLDDTLEFFENSLASVPPELRREFERVRSRLGSGKKAEVEQETLLGLNTALSTVGDDPVQFRNVTVEFRAVGQPAPVEIPAGPVEADLGAFFAVVDDEQPAADLLRPAPEPPAPAALEDEAQPGPPPG